MRRLTRFLLLVAVLFAVPSTLSAQRLHGTFDLLGDPPGQPL